MDEIFEIDSGDYSIHKLDEEKINEINTYLDNFNIKVLYNLLLTNKKLKKGSILLSQFEKITINDNEKIFKERFEDLKSLIYDLEKACNTLNLNYIYFLKIFEGDKINLDDNKKGLHAVFLCTNRIDSNILDYAIKFQSIFENPSNKKVKEEYNNSRREFQGIPKVGEYYGNALIDTDLSRKEKNLLRTYHYKEIPKSEDHTKKCIQKCKMRNKYINDLLNK